MFYYVIIGIKQKVCGHRDLASISAISKNHHFRRCINFFVSTLSRFRHGGFTQLVEINSLRVLDLSGLVDPKNFEPPKSGSS